ncbi:MAG TPA: S1 family peptidase [Kofleriaceae bacterium]|jgi:secreted trypsin-like serine protease
MRTLLVLSSALFISACVAPSTDVSTDEQAIIGGEASAGSSAVVMLVGYPSDMSVLQSCTAVLIAPTFLLTAAHCVDATDHPNYTYGIFPGDDATQYDTLVKLIPHLLPVTAVHPHPSYTPDLPFTADYDIAIVELHDALPVAPLPMRTTPITSAIANTSAQIIGYGQTTYQQFNQKRFQAMTVVTAVEGDTIVVGDSVKRSCLGDSGGPALIGGEVAGIDSYGPTGCNAAAHYRRVDSYAAFIGQYVPPTTPPDPIPDPVGDDDGSGSDTGGGGGGCSTSHASFSLVLGLALIPLRRRRR